MRIGSFIAGGLLGAAATIYLARIDKSAMRSILPSNFAQTGQSVKKMLNKMTKKDFDLTHQMSKVMDHGHDETGIRN